MEEKKSYFKTSHNVNIQRQNLKNQFLAKNLTEQGLFEQAAKLQAPTIKAIEEIQKQPTNNKLNNQCARPIYSDARRGRNYKCYKKFTKYWKKH